MGRRHDRRQQRGAGTVQQAVRQSELKDAAPVARPPRRTWVGKIAQPLLALAVVAASIIVMNRFVASAPERPSRPSVPTILTVDAVKAVPERQQPMIRAFGEIVSARMLEVRAPFAGEVLVVSEALAPGGRIAAGDVIARLDPFDQQGAVLEARANLAQARFAIVEIEARLASERDQIIEAEKQLQLARDDLERADRLRQSGGLTARQLDERSLIVSQRESTLLQRRNNIAIETARRDQQSAQIARLEWRLGQAERSLGQTVLTAPFDAIVRTANVIQGRRVNGGEVVAAIEASLEREVRFSISERDYAELLQDGQPVAGRPISLSVTDAADAKAATARIVRAIERQESAVAGTVVLVAELSGEAAATFRPGAFVQVSLPGRVHEAAVRLPETAFRENGIVHVIRDGRLQPVETTLLGMDGDDVIVAANVLAGEMVLTTRLADISAGQQVRLAGEAGGEPSGEPSAPATAPAP
jgi:multidrug efflux pump subunit AcrA (membrane-fusion protein)